MKGAGDLPLVTTIKERCRVCFTCVRECPAKAIRIVEGQAEVVNQRCIGCGNCVRVCSQNAKRVMSSREPTADLLRADGKVAAIIAPSFPAEFPDLDYRRVVGMIRELGFDLVNEVAFGADLVAREYRCLLAETDGERFIATSCPALVSFVERYHPELVARLAPIVSPMVATARALKALHGTNLRTVFVGPCIAKKGEAASENLPGEVDQALTFIELREMLEASNMTPDSVEPSDFDPPRAGSGALFPISRGMLQAARISEDLVAGEVVAADGRINFVEAIREFESGDLHARLLEVLCCEGCIMGSGISSAAPLFGRRASVSQYVRHRLERNDPDHCEAELARFADLDLRRQFAPDDQRVATPSEDQLASILGRMGKSRTEDELNCGACGYDSCREHAIAIYRGLAESEMCLPYTIDELRRTLGELADSHEQLASTQEALMQSEKLASMGQLAAGIAHEINNPLGVVLMYAHILLGELGHESEVGEDLALIADQADRCKQIVAGLLNFARQTKVILEPTDMGTLVDKCLLTTPPPSGIEVVVQKAADDPVIEVDPNQIAQVLTNLTTNGYAAMGSQGTLTVRIEGDDANCRLSVTDTGVGIPEDALGKVFEPFFTTKPMGQGTGLGLAVTYGIVKMHRGDIGVQSNSDASQGPTGTTFTVTLPRNQRRTDETRVG